MKPRAVCAYCGCDYQLTLAGRFRAHRAQHALDVSPTPWCRGSGHSPAEATANNRMRDLQSGTDAAQVKP
jgi:hypothetical protein